MPITISGLLPPIFDNYLVIFWIPGIIDNFPFEEIVQPPDTIDQINNNVRIWNKFNIEFNSDSEEIYRQTTFKELSELFQKPYDLQILNTLPWQTRGIKILRDQTKLRLERIVELLSSNKNLHLYFEDYLRWSDMSKDFPIENEVKYDISQNDFFDLMTETSFDATLYLYPPQKEWCLLNLEDLPFNLLAYNNSVKDKINHLNIKDTLKLSANAQINRYTCNQLYNKQFLLTGTRRLFGF